MSHVAFIPARSGSVGIKDKNLKKVHGTSLIKRTFDHCNASQIFQSVIVSTDSFRIAKQVFEELDLKEFNSLKENQLIEIGNKSYFHKRKLVDSLTTSPISNVIFEISKSLNFEYLWLLQPTSPFRKTKEFKFILNVIKDCKLNEIEWTSIVSFKSVGNSHPDRMVKLNGRYVTPILENKLGDNVPRQVLEPIFIKDGGFYVFKIKNLRNNVMLGDRIIPYFREGFHTINIDSLEDLNSARSIPSLKRA
jgi:CMP-N-acetylneuraminic acid synthetase